MQAVDYHTLIDTLAESFTRQNRLYVELEGLVQKILNQLVLRRGDLPGAMPLFERKQELIEAISAERERTRRETERWSREKGECPSSAETERLDAILGRTQELIGRYLRGEEQLRTFLEHLMPSQEGAGDGKR